MKQEENRRGRGSSFAVEEAEAVGSDVIRCGACHCEGL